MARKYITTGVERTLKNDDEKREVARYTIDGRRINGLVKGINIVKYADGTTKKVVVE